MILRKINLIIRSNVKIFLFQQIINKSCFRLIFVFLPTDSESFSIKFNHHEVYYKLCNQLLIFSPFNINFSRENLLSSNCWLRLRKYEKNSPKELDTAAVINKYLISQISYILLSLLLFLDLFLF